MPADGADRDADRHVAGQLRRAALRGAVGERRAPRAPTPTATARSSTRSCASSASMPRPRTAIARCRSRRRERRARRQPAASALPRIFAETRTLSPLQGGGEALVIAGDRLYFLLDEHGQCGAGAGSASRRDEHGPAGPRQCAAAYDPARHRERRHLVLRQRSRAGAAVRAIATGAGPTSSAGIHDRGDRGGRPAPRSRRSEGALRRSRRQRQRTGVRAVAQPGMAAPSATRARPRTCSRAGSTRTRWPTSSLRTPHLRDAPRERDGERRRVVRRVRRAAAWREPVGFAAFASAGSLVAADTDGRSPTST